MRILFAAALLLAAIPSAGSAQLFDQGKAPCSQVAPDLTYDVVSIHPNHSGTGNFNATWGNDRYNATNIALIQVIEQAYGLRDNQISGVPDSIASTQFDIAAKVLGSDPATPVKLSDRQLQCMLIPLLADRFHLRSHLETRTMPVFDLVLLKTAPKLTPAASDLKSGNISMNRNNNAWELHATAVTMVDFALTLAQERQQTVTDKTELPGRYTFTLTWLRDGAPDTDPNAPPSIFTALQEQLGLKLQPAKGPVDTLVVDHIELPTEN